MHARRLPVPTPRARRATSSLAALLAAAGFGAAAPAAATAEVVWLCKPGMADNPCEIPRDTTVQEHGRPDAVETPAAGPRDVDCFYVYPTVSNQPTPTATKSRDPELVSIARYQAARFSQECRVYAPIYRQSTLLSIASERLLPRERSLGYNDVLEAWREYLERHNDGRGVVLVGHSQGTRMLRELLRREIEATDAKRRVVSALLLGGDVTVRAGDVVGGDFRETPLCTRPVEVRCVVAFSTFAEDPPEDSRFGTAEAPEPGDESTLPGGPGYEAACTDPRPLAGVTGPLRLLTPSEPFAPGLILAGIVVTSGGAPPSAPTTWVVAPDRFDGACRVINGAHVLRYDPLPGSRRPRFFPEDTWGTHLVDVNLALEPLVTLVGRQAERWTRPQLRLTRTCAAGGGLRAAVAGRDADFVRDVSFKLGRRLVARDTAAPLRRTIPRTAVRRTSARSLRAVAHLRAGAPERLVLERTLPRC